MTDIKITVTFMSDNWNQTINMYKEAYNNMIANPATRETSRKWANMSNISRIAEHLKLIQQDLRANKFEFIIHND